MYLIEGFVPLKKRAACIIPMPASREESKEKYRVRSGSTQFRYKWSKLVRSMKAFSIGAR